MCLSVHQMAVQPQKGMDDDGRQLFSGSDVNEPQLNLQPCFPLNEASHCLNMKRQRENMSSYNVLLYILY